MAMGLPSGSSPPSCPPHLAAATVSGLLTSAARTPGAGGLVSCALRQCPDVSATGTSAAAAAAAATSASASAAGGDTPHPASLPPTEVVAGRPLRYATLEGVVSAVAAELASVLPTTGQRVAVLAPTGVIALAYLFAIARAAAVSVPLNTRWNVAELATAIEDGAVAEQRASSSFSREPPPATVLLPPTPPSTAIATIIYTSGTTAAPKGVCLTHAALAAAVAIKLRALPYTPSMVYLHLAPLFHVGGFSSALAVTAVGGGHAFLPAPPAVAVAAGAPSPPFPDIVSLTRSAIPVVGVTTLVGVPSVLAALVTPSRSAPLHPPATPESLPLITYPTVTMLFYGGAPLPAALVPRLAAAFPAAHLVGAYGLTEAASSVAFVHHGPLSAAARAVGGDLGWGGGCQDDAAANDTRGSSAAGHPPPGVRLRIGPGGEVLVASPTLMAGYWGDPDRTATTLDVGGRGGGGGRVCPGGRSGGDDDDAGPWLHTGDLGRLDASGCLWVTGRSKDVIKSGGEAVHAGQVEGVLGAHPAVAGCAVVGLPHGRWGEAVVAAVVAAAAAAAATMTAAAAAATTAVTGGAAPPVVAPTVATSGGAPIGTMTLAAGLPPLTPPSFPSAAAVTATTVAAGPTERLEREMIAWCARRLSGFKVPKRVFFLDALPTTASGKVHKGLLRQQLLRLGGGLPSAVGGKL
ncbi:hypothetical protein MMPV_003856 [Pyropia vietnamensis]